VVEVGGVCRWRAEGMGPWVRYGGSVGGDSGIRVTGGRQEGVVAMPFPYAGVGLSVSASLRLLLPLPFIDTR
jgi:hypothetical protein